MPENKLLKIGELASQLKVSTDTLRFYEKNKLLKPKSRSDSGYRYYGHEEIDRMHFILRAKSVGFSLNEIKELLNIQLQKNKKSCEDVKKLTQRKINEVSEKIEELEKFQRALQKLNKNCSGGKLSAKHCTILESLES